MQGEPGFAVLLWIIPCSFPHAVLAGTLVSGHHTHPPDALPEAGSLSNLGVLPGTCLDTFASVFIKTCVQIGRSLLFVQVVARLPDDCTVVPQSGQGAVLLPSLGDKWGNGWRPEGAGPAHMGLVRPACLATQPGGPGY